MKIIHSTLQIMQKYDLDAQTILFGCFGILSIIVGGMILNANPQNFQVGYPTIAIGFAFFVFADNRHNSIVSTKKTDQIFEKLKGIQEQLNQIKK